MSGCDNHKDNHDDDDDDGDDDDDDNDDEKIHIKPLVVCSGHI